MDRGSQNLVARMWKPGSNSRNDKITLGFYAKSKISQNNNEFRIDFVDTRLENNAVAAERVVGAPSFFDSFIKIIPWVNLDNYVIF